jgi:hypothetical protein
MSSGGCSPRFVVGITHDTLRQRARGGRVEVALVRLDVLSWWLTATVLNPGNVFCTGAVSSWSGE